jgi:cob(I)alamin adenosyltransferase
VISPQVGSLMTQHPSPPERAHQGLPAAMLGVGRIILNTGDGKGKTTAAFGLALRASGHGQKTAIVQFIKGTWNYGEAMALQGFPNIELHRIGSGFTWLAEDPEVPRKLALEAWRLGIDLAKSDRYDLLILDEIVYAMKEGYITTDDVLAMLAEKPSRLSVVLTGRDAPPELIEVADTVTDMASVKHAFDRGVPARRGIEY